METQQKNEMKISNQRHSILPVNDLFMLRCGFRNGSYRFEPRAFWHFRQAHIEHIVVVDFERTVVVHSVQIVLDCRDVVQSYCKRKSTQ